MKMNIDIAKKFLVLAVLILIAVAAWVPKLDAPAMEQVDAGMKRAFVTFAAARALNAAISLAQGTEFTMGVGAQVTLSVGEILDPVNDLVEAFSNFMLLATVAFGIQKALLMMGQYEYVKVLLIGIMTVWGVVYLSGKKPPRLLHNLFILMLMARFGIPVVTVGSDFVFKQFLEKGYQSSQVGIASAANSISQLAPVAQKTVQQKNGWWDKVKDSVATLDPRPRIEALKRKADEAVREALIK